MVKFSLKQLYYAVAASSFSLLTSTVIADDTTKKQESEQLFSYSDVFALEYATGMTVHPNGKQVIYERRSMDIMKDRQRSNLWAIDIDGKNHRPLLTGSASYRSPKYSPSGDRLAYLSANDQGTQIYARWLDTGATVRVTDLQKSPSNITWSPDGKWLAFTMMVDAPKKPLFKGPKPPKGAKWAGSPRVIDNIQYQADGVGFLPSAFAHIFIVPSEGGTPRQITKGNFHHRGRIAWTKDSSAIITNTNYNDNWELDPAETNLFRYDVKNGKTTQLTNRKGPEANAKLSPNGKKILFTGMVDKGLSSPNTVVWSMDLDGSNIKQLTKNFDRSVASAEWTNGGRDILISYDDHGKRVLATVNNKGDVTPVTDRIGGTTLGRPYTSGSFTAAGRKGAVITLGRIDRPADLAYVDARGNVTPLTDLNSDALGHKKMANAQRINIKSSFDGRDIEAWLSLPPGVNSTKNLPLVLEIHGGPHTAYGPNFSPEIQLYAAAGYAVLYANPRGSTSYGEEFANLIHQNYPSQDHNDLMDLVDHVVEKGIADKDRLFITGGSGGGTLTAWAVGNTNRFQAAVVAKPVINWTSFNLTADGAAYFSKYWFAKHVWEDISDHWKRSPLRLVGNVETPTMLLTGARDIRTPMSETQQYYMALKLRGIDTAMVQIPEAFHGIAARPSNLIQKVGHILTWFKKYDEQADKKKAGEKTADKKAM